MPDIGDLRRLCLGIPDPTTKRVLVDVVESLVGRVGIQLGVPEENTRSKNLAGYFLTGTSSTTANTEFSIVHGLGRRPYVVVPVLDPQTVGSQTIRLRTTRVADTQRISLASPDTGAAVTLLVEG